LGGKGAGNRDGNRLRDRDRTRGRGGVRVTKCGAGDRETIVLICRIWS